MSDSLARDGATSQRGGSGRDWNPHRQRAAEYLRTGEWRTETLVDVVRANRRAHQAGVAWFDETGAISWSAADELSDRWAAALLSTGAPRGGRVAVLLPDGWPVHVGFLAVEKAGLVAVGIGARAGYAEARHIVAATRASVVLTSAECTGVAAEAIVQRLSDDGLAIQAHCRVDEDGGVLVDGRAPDDLPAVELATLIEQRRCDATEPSMVNSTSGTTGMPKCVLHNQNRWWYFHQLAVAAAALRTDDVFFSAVPMPFGFGLWTSHFTPAFLGAPVGVPRRFSPRRTLRFIEEQRVTVLACVSSQFSMLLDVADQSDVDLSSLRAMFTGGEAVPRQRAERFEDRFGATVLQFYGSNETGALSCTSLNDSREIRLGSAGRVIERMEVGIADPGGRRIVARCGTGQPACRGPATSLGYLDDDEANAELFTDDGWMLMGDVVEIDEQGVLRVVGRLADFIIRGGKNVSAPAVEAEVATHPAVALVAAVPVPDETLGERVGVFVTLQPGCTLTLDELVEHLRARDVSRDMIPERFAVVEQMPVSSGGKIAKGELRGRAATALGQGAPGSNAV